MLKAKATKAAESSCCKGRVKVLALCCRPARSSASQEVKVGEHHPRHRPRARSPGQRRAHPRPARKVKAKCKVRAGGGFTRFGGGSGLERGLRWWQGSQSFALQAQARARAPDPPPWPEIGLACQGQLIASRSCEASAPATRAAKRGPQQAGLLLRASTRLLLRWSDAVDFARKDKV